MKTIISDGVGVETIAAGSGLSIDAGMSLSKDLTVSGNVALASDLSVGGNTTLSGTYLTMAGVTQTGGRKQIISTGVVLTSAQSGAILIADGGSAQTFTLPAPAQGLHFKMYAGAAYAHKIQVPAGAAKIYGNAINTNNEQAEKAEGQKVTAAISVAFGVALQGGDFMEVVCNGSHWFLHAVTNDPLTITT